jgi:hypothetical protein
MTTCTADAKAAISALAAAAVMTYALHVSQHCLHNICHMAPRCESLSAAPGSIAAGLGLQGKHKTASPAGSKEHFNNTSNSWVDRQVVGSWRSASPTAASGWHVRRQQLSWTLLASVAHASTANMCVLKGVTKGKRRWRWQWVCLQNVASMFLSSVGAAISQTYKRSLTICCTASSSQPCTHLYSSATDADDNVHMPCQ